MAVTDTTPSLDSSTRRVKLARVTGVTGVAGLVMLPAPMGSSLANIYASFTSDPDQTVTFFRSIDDAFDVFSSSANAAGLTATLWFALGLALLLSAIRRPAALALDLARRRRSGQCDVGPNRVVGRGGVSLRRHRSLGGALRVRLRQHVVLEQLGRNRRALALRGPDHLVGQVAASWWVAGRSSPTSPGWGWA